MGVIDGGYANEDPRPTFGYTVKELRKRHPELAFMEVLEPRVAGGHERTAKESESNDFLREIWRGKPYIANGGYNRESAIEQAEKSGELVSLARWYTSNVCGISDFCSHLMT